MQSLFQGNEILLSKHKNLLNEAVKHHNLVDQSRQEELRQSQSRDQFQIKQM